MGKPLRLLMVEDSENDAELIMYELRRAGFDPVHERVDERGDLRMALEKQPWDIVISDYAMPQFTGLDALQMVRQKDVNLPFIIVSGTIGEDIAVGAMQAGANDYLMKGNLIRLSVVIERELREAAVRRQRQETEQALKESEAVFRSLSASSPMGIFMADLQGHTTYTNRQCRALLKLTMMETLGEGWAKAIHPEDQERMLEEWFAFVAKPGNVGFSAECRLQTREKASHWIRVQAFPMRNEDAELRGYVGTVEDVTERKHLEAQLIQAQKVEAVGRLAGGVAHDFNNILTAIMGYSELMSQRIRPDDPLRQNVEEIKTAAERAASLTRQLLAFSRKQVLELKVFDVRDTVANLEKMLHRLIGEDIELVTRAGTVPTCVKADPGQIEQVIMNMVVNARDAMPKGGNITIETSIRTLDREYARRNPEVKPGEYVMLTIHDSGTGMSDEVKAHLFEPFFTTKPQGKGTGLGLATCYGIVKQSDGHIAVSSDSEHGTKFEVYLPLAQETPVALPRREQAQDLPHGNETILAVEDEAGVRELVKLLLHSLGYTVLAAASGEEALKILRERGDQQIHLLLTDMIMPQMSGRILAEQVRKILPQIKVLFTSGYTDDEILNDGIREPGLAFLQKPYTNATLAHKVRESLDS